MGRLDEKSDINTIYKTLIKKSMKEYPNLGRVAKLENDAAFTQDKDGYVNLNEEQADVIEAAIVSAVSANEDVANELADKTAQLEAAQKELEDIKAEKQTLEENLKTAQDEVAELKANAEKFQNDAELNAKTVSEENEKALDAANAKLDEAVATLNAKHDEELAELNAKFEEAQKSLAEKEQLIADLNQKLTEVDNQPKAQEQSAPKNNGAQTPSMKLSKGYKYNPSLSPMENKKIRDEYNAKLMQMAEEHANDYEA